MSTKTRHASHSLTLLNPSFSVDSFIIGSMRPPLQWLSNYHWLFSLRIIEYVILNGKLKSNVTYIHTSVCIYISLYIYLHIYLTWFEAKVNYIREQVLRALLIRSLNRRRLCTWYCCYSLIVANYWFTSTAWWYPMVKVFTFWELN